jgi:catechol 2,3-dioxygenase-like lactoylglutathione lyase family enzyme
MPLVPLGVLETSLYVADLDRSIAFYRDVLGLKQIPGGLFEGGRGAALQAGDGPSVLLLFRAEITKRGGQFPPHGTAGAGHAAFRIDAEQVSEWRKRLLDHGIAIEKELSFGGNPPSLYFRDPDGNSLELSVATIWKLGKASRS